MDYRRNKKGQFAQHSRSLLGRILSYPFRVIWQWFVALKWDKKVIVGIMVLCAALPAYDALAPRFTPKTLVYVANRVEAAELEGLSGDRLDRKVLELKTEVLDTLQKCESGGKDNLAIVFDTNGVASVGVFQWQPHSFRHYWQQKTGEKITEREAIIKALDNDTARKLAHYVIFETEKGSKSDWKNCTSWHGLTAKIEIIKDLES